MEKLRIKRKDIYEIEVNDNGDTICFEMGDVTLPIRLNSAYEEISKIQQRLQQQLTIINKKQDFKRKNQAMTNNQLECQKVQNQAFCDMRKAMDNFLGKDGCQKIFGDSNYYEMYNDLFDELTKKDENGLSHLDKMKISSDAIDKRIEEKYKQAKNMKVI